MKRFTETDKWKDPWFRKLDPEVKLLWNFICDQCDNAGVWDPDEELFHFCSGAQVPLGRGLEALGDRVECLKNGKWWIRKFVDFQFGRLVDTNNCHRSVKALLSKHDISAPGQGHLRGTPGGQEKEKEKEKDKEGGMGGEKYGDARIALHFLNEATGRHFRELDTNLSVISARLSEPEVTLEGVKQMIARQCQRWKGDSKMEEFLRPETLFGKTKFDSYYAAKDQPIHHEQPKSTASRPNSIQGNDRNAGTYNEGAAANYRNAAELTQKRAGISRVQDPIGPST